ncbi:cobyric acid synthase [Candidatus Hodgkinia cicadicola]
MANCLMIQATGSNVGKSFICACLCRIAKEIGISVAPFKAQNMCTATVLADTDIGEISMAQWNQAIACGKPSFSKMNSLLVKPLDNNTSQLYIDGELVRNKNVYPSNRKFKTRLRAQVLLSLDSLLKQNDLVIIEGAGASAEANLRSYDLSNMWLANAVSCNIVLISDLERGGALASIAGTRCLLSKHDACLIKGFILNKFVGKLALLRPGINSLEQTTLWPCYGVIPWIPAALSLPREDTLCEHFVGSFEGAIGIIVDIPFGNGISELNALSLEPNVKIILLKSPPVLGVKRLKFIIIPDADSPISTLNFLYSSGWKNYLYKAHNSGILIIGIGTSLQILASSFAIGPSIYHPGLKILNVNVLCFKILPHKKRCISRLLSADIIVNVSLHILYFESKCNSSDRVEALIEDTTVWYGVHNANVWGLAVNNPFLDDNFRSAFLQFVGLRPSRINYKNYVEKAIIKATCELATNISPNLFALLGC